MRFVQHLLGELDKPDIELVLFDISQPLLNTAYQYALDTFGEQSPVHTLMMQGNFHDLAQYPQVSYAPAKGRRRRIYTVLGNIPWRISTMSCDFSSTACLTVGQVIYCSALISVVAKPPRVRVSKRSGEPTRSYKVRFPNHADFRHTDSDALARRRQLRTSSL